MSKFKAGVYEASAYGNQSRIVVEVTFSEDKIEDVKIKSHEEIRGMSWGIPTAPIETLPGEIVKHQSIGVPQVLGAERTSRAILKAVGRAIEAAEGSIEELSTPVVPAKHEDEVRNVDILIVGGGAGGLAAAVEAKRAGANTLLVEKAGITGGSAVRSGGKLLASGTKWQKEQGIYDTPDMLFEYLMETSDGKADPQKIRYFADHAYESILWLEDMGYHVQDVEAIHESVFPWRVYNSPGGYYMSNGQGGEITVPMHEEYEGLGGEIVFNCGMKELIMEDGLIKGAIFEYNSGGTMTVYAKDTILATGGYGRDRETCESRYAVKGYYSDVPTTNIGDGIKAAAKIGAEEFISPSIQVNYCSLYNGTGINAEAGLQVTKEGKRVVNEWNYQYVIGDALRAAGSNCSWYITCGDEPYPSINRAFAGKETKTEVFADSIEELAVKMGVDPDTLKATVDRYNSMSDAGCDEDFNKPAKFLFPIKGPRYAAFFFTPCVTVTYGGLITDLCARVLDGEGVPIPHLYATGETASTGIYGTVYPGCGTSIGTAILWGRVAARLATGQAML